MTIISVALEQLFPNGDPETDWEVRDDGNGDYIAQWNLAEPQPSQAELDQAYLEYQADQDTANTTLIAIKNQAQSAVGVALADLTQSQVKALVAILLWQAGGVDKDGVVNPLGEWVR